MYNLGTVVLLSTIGLLLVKPGPFGTSPGFFL